MLSFFFSLHHVGVNCGRPQVENPQLMKVFGRSFHYGDTAMYICRPGLNPAHIPPVITCTQTGRWDKQPACKGNDLSLCLSHPLFLSLSVCLSVCLSLSLSLPLSFKKNSG